MIDAFSNERKWFTYEKLKTSVDAKIKDGKERDEVLKNILDIDHETMAEKIISFYVKEQELRK